MNRIEFMTELAALLQDVPEEERRDAMQFYNDYFDDAGEDKEDEVIAELESPGKVAEKIKADLLGQQAEKAYTETGCEDGGREDMHMPVKGSQSAGGYTYQGGSDTWSEGKGTYRYGDDGETAKEQKPWSNNVLKVLLIIAIVIFGAPIIIPCALAIAGVVIAGIAALFAFFFAIVICFITIAIVGAVLVGAGILTLIPEIAVGLALIGTGLILGVIGVIGTVAGVKLCIVVFPGICRGIVWICRRPFQGRKAVV